MDKALVVRSLRMEFGTQKAIYNSGRYDTWSTIPVDVGGRDRKLLY